MAARLEEYLLEGLAGCGVGLRGGTPCERNDFGEYAGLPRSAKRAGRRTGEIGWTRYFSRSARLDTRFFFFISALAALKWFRLATG